MATQSTSSNKGMTLIIKTIARLISGFIFLYGIYIILHGHLTPGGGFAGGIIIAGAFVLTILAYGSEARTSESRKQKASLGESLGILFFWFIAVLGLLIGGIFFLNFFASKGQAFHLFSAGIIPLCNMGIGLEVGGALFAIFITLAILRRGNEENK